MLAKDLLKEEFSEKEKRNIEILEVLRRYGPISRPEISREIGINIVSISNYIDEFIKHKLVFEKDLDVSEGGRRPALLELNPQRAYIIGAGLNLMNMVGLLVDLKGNIITKTQVARPKASVREIAECLMDIVGEILRRSKDYTPLIRGIGIGIAGLINKKTGSIHWPEKSDHTYTYASVDLPLRELMEREFNISTLIENDATAASFGEYCFSLDRRLKNVIYMFSGVGSGIIINGDIYTGTDGYAGEVSIHPNYKEQDLFACALGKDCFIKRWEIDLGIIDEIKSQLAKDKDSRDKFFHMSGTRSLEELDLRNIFIAVKAGEPVANQALESAAKRLGIKIAYLINFLNPDAVVIGGGMEEAGENFLNKVSLTVKEWAFREATENLKIVYSQVRENAVALGAASLVMRRLFARLL